MMQLIERQNAKRQKLDRPKFEAPVCESHLINTAEFIGS